MKLLTFGILSLALALNAFAVETKICHISSDIDSETTDLLIETDSNGDLDSIRLYKMVDSKVVSDETHPTERVISDGVVASIREGRDIVILRAKSFNPVLGGIIALDFLYNGISGSRKTFNMKLTKVGDKFVLTTVDGANVSKLIFVGNRVLGKVVGIKEIQSFK